MKNSLILTAMAVLPLMSPARQLTPQEALDRALGDAPAKVSAQLKAQYDVSALAAVIETDGQKLLYIIDRTDHSGYVILSADDVAVPVLGYVDAGSYDESRIPDNAAWWLQEYQRQILWAIEQGAPSASLHTPEREDIAPLIQTLWNQDSPYNDLCPKYTGARCVTGCVATAMAQVMKYYEWPETGQGSNAYTPKNFTEQLSMDFSEVTFDWGNMLDDYDYNSTSASREAVAQLMLACGISVNMNYGRNASSAYSKDMVPALINYFDYDVAAAEFLRKYFTDQTWEQKVYDELAAGRPLAYGGEGAGGGHEFVCDGYNNGYFHINWGWGGLSDGYYLLSALDPYYNGIGGYDSGYDYNQSAIFGIQKPQPDSKPTIIVYAENGFYAAQTSYPRISSVTFSGNGGLFYNGGATPINIQYGIKCVDPAGGVVYVSSKVDYTLPSYTGTYTIRIRGSYLPEGTYTIYPAVYDVDTESWSDMYVLPTAQTRMRMRVTSDKVEVVPYTEISLENALVYVDDLLTDEIPVNYVAKNADDEWGANRIDITDGCNFYNPCTVSAAQVNYTRQYVADVWTSMYLPVAVTGEAWRSFASQALKFKGQEEVEGEVLLVFEKFTEGDDMEANTPYLIYPTVEGEHTLTLTDCTLQATPLLDLAVKPRNTDYSLYGTYLGVDDMAAIGAYTLSQESFVKAAETVQLPPFRAYIIPNDESTASDILTLSIKDAPNGIEDILNTSDGTGLMYDLQGRKVDHPDRGIYILNGHKILIK